MSSASTKSAVAPAATAVATTTPASAPRAAAQRRTRIEDANVNDEHDGITNKSDDVVAHDAVMQLAKAAAHDEAHQSHLQQPSQADDSPANKKRRKISASNDSGAAEGYLKSSQTTAASEEPATAAPDAGPFGSSLAWTQNENLANLFASASESNHASGNGNTDANKAEQTDSSGAAQIDVGDATFDSQHTGNVTADQDGVGDESGEAVLLARNGRPLNASKRAAQNRAAQRAFRARRDEYVRQVEEKAKQFDELVAASAMYKQRYEEARRTVDLLHDYNHALRLAIDATGGRLPTPPLGVEEAVEQLQASSVEPAPVSTAVSKDEGGDLDGLSAVAAAAAASAASAGEPSSTSERTQPKDT